MVPGFRKRLLSGEKLPGTMLTLPSAAVAEILADSGFDWLFVDCEHGAMDTRAVQEIVQAVGHRCACIVRIPELNEGTIKRVLDVGAQGIIVPAVNTAEAAAETVKYSRYSPIGERGAGIGRAQRYGRAFAEYTATANEEIVVVVQAEHRRAVDAIDSITSVNGIDCVLLGPYDLSASFGLMGQIDHPQVVSAIDKVLENCRNKGISTGYFGVTPEVVREYGEKGCTLLISGVDVTFLSAGASRMHKQMTQPDPKSPVEQTGQEVRGE